MPDRFRERCRSRVAVLGLSRGGAIAATVAGTVPGVAALVQWSGAVYNWREAPGVKARLAGGYCVRAPAQGACPYANICEHCPSFHTDTTSRPILAAQRADTAVLAADAEHRGWTDDAARHHALIARLDVLLAADGTAQTG